MTPSELKKLYKEKNPDGHYFDYSAMRFFGDTMANFKVDLVTINGHDYYRLSRKKPVKSCLVKEAYFDAETLIIKFPR
jgi:hypothetical protein